VLFNAENFGPLHRGWLAATAILTVAASAWYWWTWQGAERLPGGGSLPGLAFGIAAGLICLFEFSLLVRRRLFRTRRTFLGLPLGTARHWMAAHIWLGVLAVPLVFMHAGFQFGGWVTFVLAWSFIIVTLSGALGLALQNILPRLMTEIVGEESVYSQIKEVGEQMASDAIRLASLYGGEPAAVVVDDSPRDPALRRALDKRLPIIGAPRHVGTMISLSRQPSVQALERGSSPDLALALDEEVVQYLKTGFSPTGWLRSAARAEWYFDDLRRRVPPSARSAVEQLEVMCQRRRQLNLQSWFHVWLHGWLSVHLPLSTALIILLFAHIVGALAYN
jgi:hypothetical protein